MLTAEFITSNAYPIFLILLLLTAVKIIKFIHDEVGSDVWDHKKHLEAQNKLHRRWQMREKIRKIKKRAEEKIDKLMKKNNKENNDAE